MENLTRLLSWTFVFGAIAALVFTSIRPVWKDVIGADLSIDQVQGTMGAPESSENLQVSATPANCRDAQLTANDDCANRTP